MPAGLAAWLDERRRWIFWGLIVLSLATRAIYAWQFADSPLREWHRWPESDMAFFDEWSQDIAAGNWLQRKPHHPLHSWHKELAELHFEEGGSGRPAGVSPEIAARTLWNRWYGGVRFHQEPLYAYALAILKRSIGRPLMAMFCLQLLAGVTANLLIWEIGRRCFGPVTGVLAGLLAVLSPTLLYVDLVLLRESFITCVGLGLVWMMLAACSSPSKRNWMILGFAGGVALLLKATLAILVAGCAWVCVAQVRRRPQSASQFVLFSAGILAGLSPAIFRNVVVRAPAFSLSSVAAITFVNTNASDSAPLGFPISWEYAPQIMDQTGGSLFPAVIQTCKTHTPWSLADFLWRKWSGIWNGFEAPDNISFSFFQLEAPVLRWLPFSFAILSPLALVGLGMSFVASWRSMNAVSLTTSSGVQDAGRGAPLWPLQLLVANHLIALLFFTQVGRLRVPLVAALIPFAAFSIIQLHDVLRNSRLKGVLLLIVLGLVTAWTTTSNSREFTEFRAVDFAVADQLHYQPQIAAASEREDWSSIATLLSRQLGTEPKLVRNLQPKVGAQNPQERELARLFAKAHLHYAKALQQLDRADEAAREFQRGNELLDVASRSAP